MTYVTDMNSKELDTHMRMLTNSQGWHDPLCDRLWKETKDLHEANQAMLEALKYMREVCPAIDQSGEDAHRFAIEAIAKVEQQ